MGEESPCIRELKRGDIQMDSILTYEMEKSRKGCINRDSNAVENMLIIVTEYIMSKTRLL